MLSFVPELSKSPQKVMVLSLMSLMREVPAGTRYPIFRKSDSRISVVERIVS
jgi:hypothetical protein